LSCSGHWPLAVPTGAGHVGGMSTAAQTLLEEFKSPPTPEPREVSWQIQRWLDTTGTAPADTASIRSARGMTADSGAGHHRPRPQLVAGNRGRPVTIQYCLPKGVNDSAEHPTQAPRPSGRPSPCRVSVAAFARQPPQTRPFFRPLRHFLGPSRRSRCPSLSGKAGQTRKCGHQEMKSKNDGIRQMSARYSRVIEWSGADGCFVGSAPPLVGQCCHGDTEAEVAAPS
jgi:hypothetical protein